MVFAVSDLFEYVFYVPLGVHNYAKRELMRGSNRCFAESCEVKDGTFANNMYHLTNLKTSDSDDRNGVIKII